MIHPDTELRLAGPGIGHGVFATRPIPRGTITWGLCHLDHVLSPARAAELPSCYGGILSTYAYVTSQGDSVLCWDIGRYVNHSCSPACLSLSDELEIAVRDILPGEEVTDDYGMLNLPRPLQCRCGAPHCRGVVRADDVLRLGREWEARIGSAFALAPRVPQPLLPYLKHPRHLSDMLEGRTEVPSPLAYCVPSAAACPGGEAPSPAVPAAGVPPASS